MLGFIEAVDFVDEEEGTFIGLVFGHLKNVAKFGDVGCDGVDAYEVCMGFVCNDFGEGGFSASWRAIEHDAAELVCFDESR